MISGVKAPRVVLLAGPGESSRIVYHILREEFGDVQVILEDAVSVTRLVRKRVRTLGPMTVIGQVAFMLMALPLLRRAAAPRINAIKRGTGLDDSPIDGQITRVRSVNSEGAIHALRQFNPSIVVVNGTRILGRRVLSAVQAPFLNIHAGITPLFRGVHGGYWALVEGRPDLTGTTVHFVDEGIDTGRIVAHARFEATKQDSFATYPYLHLAAIKEVLNPAIRHVLSGSPREFPVIPDLPSKLRTHPTLFQYVYGRIAHGVR